MSKTRVFILNKYTAHIFWFLVGCISLMISLYGYLIFSTIFYAADIEVLGASLEDARTSLSSVEHTYIAMSERIDMTLAREMGFREYPDDPHYVSKRQTTAALLGGNGL
jgi:hypothetical protein